LSSKDSENPHKCGASNKVQKTILVTGSTDGIGLATAKVLVSQGHHVLLHGRNRPKLQDAEKVLTALQGGGHAESYVADLSRMADVEALAIDKAAVPKIAEPLTGRRGEQARLRSTLTGNPCFVG
jgi:NAD(P)-dependent dehydrogenase (short-subunit alcohol dehydrogenase family)